MVRRTIGKPKSYYLKMKDSEKQNKKILAEDVRKIEALRKKGDSFYTIAKKISKKKGQKVSMNAVRYWYLMKNEKEKFDEEREKRKKCFKKWYNERKDEKTFKKIMKQKRRENYKKLLKRKNVYIKTQA